MTTIQYTDGSSGYVPGACNLGRAEIAQRRRVGALGIVGAIVAAAVLLAVGADPILRALVFVPLAGGFIGLIQARERFCMGYALAGMYNVTDAMGTPSRVTDGAARRADMRHAVVVLAKATIPAALITLLFVLLPA